MCLIVSVSGLALILHTLTGRIAKLLVFAWNKVSFFREILCVYNSIIRLMNIPNNHSNEERAI